SPPPPDTSPLPLHDALPIWALRWAAAAVFAAGVVAMLAVSIGRRAAVPTDTRVHRIAVMPFTDLSHASPSTAAISSTASTSSPRSEEHTSELQSRGHLVCRL